MILGLILVGLNFLFGQFVVDDAPRAEITVEQAVDGFSADVRIEARNNQFTWWDYWPVDIRFTDDVPTVQAACQAAFELIADYESYGGIDDRISYADEQPRW